MCSAQSALAAYSSIVEATGESCEADGGDAQRLQLALTDARRNAAEAVQTSVDSYSKVNNYVVVEDLIESYSNASVETRYKTACAVLDLRGGARMDARHEDTLCFASTLSD